MRTLFILFTATALLASCKKDEMSNITPTPHTQSIVTKPVVVIPNRDSIPDGGRLNIRLMQDSSAIDETALAFEHDGSDKFNNNNDARYFPGFGIGSLSSMSEDSVPCAIQTIPFNARYAIRLNVHAKRDGVYILKISLFDNIPAGTHVWLQDLMRKDSLDLRVGGYTFNVVNTDTASYGSNRFRIVLR